MNVHNADDLQNDLAIKSVNLTHRKCLKCESICRAGAISISSDS